MGNIIIGHGQNGDLGDRAVDALYNSGTLVQSGQLTVEISGEALSGRNLSLGGGNLTHGLGKRGHIRQDYQNVHILFKGQIFSQGQGNLGSNQTLYHRVVGQV